MEHVYQQYCEQIAPMVIELPDTQQCVLASTRGTLRQVRRYTMSQQCDTL